MPQPLSRRSVIKAGGSLWATAALSGQFAAIAKAAADNRAEHRLTTLTPDEAACAEAVAARILPTTDTPGAREAGAVWFMDAALAGDKSDDMATVREGIRELDQAAGGAFARLSPEQQDALLREREDSAFFGAMHFLTVAGTFTMASYGGNRDNVGWKMLGLADQHHWQPPFGHYDRDMHREMAQHAAQTPHGEQGEHGERDA